MKVTQDLTCLCVGSTFCGTASPPVRDWNPCGWWITTVHFNTYPTVCCLYAGNMAVLWYVIHIVREHVVCSTVSLDMLIFVINVSWNTVQSAIQWAAEPGSTTPNALIQSLAKVLCYLLYLIQPPWHDVTFWLHRNFYGQDTGGCSAVIIIETDISGGPRWHSG
jgi:hypothetical protein